MKCKNLKIKSKKGYCKLYDKEVSVFCNECPFEVKYDIEKLKKSNNHQIKRKPIRGTKHKITKATEISKKVKLIVWERDNHQCIFCGTPVPWNMANSHFIKRSHLGLGIEQNIMTNCLSCHDAFEKEPKDGWMHEKARRHFREHYDDWNEKNLVYKKIS